MKNLYLFKCVFYVCLGLYGYYTKSDFTIGVFSLAFIMAILHIDMLINKLAKQQEK